MAAISLQTNAKTTNSTESVVRDPQIPDIALRVVQSLCSRSLFKSSPARELAPLSPLRLKKVLENVISQLANSADALGSLDELAKSIPLEQLQEAVRIQYPTHVDALKTAQQMFRGAKHRLETTEQNLSPSLRSQLNQIINSLLSVLESILSAFGIAEFFKPAESDIHADFKGQKIMMLLSLFSLLSAILLPILGVVLGAQVIGGTLLSIATISLIYPHIKPAPSVLPKADNWTRKIQQGTLQVVDGRKEISDEIARTLIASKNIKTHPMLIGQSGVGKTEAVKAFAQAVERGDYPELAGKQVFYINTTDLVNGSELLSSANKNLQKLNEAIGRHRENIILVFDEIHKACQDREQSVLGDQMKTLLDPGSENFPYCIGITTEDEFYRDIYVNNPAFARRFRRITVGNTDQAETLKILNNMVLQQATKAILERGILGALFEKTMRAFSETAAQPATSLKILSTCIQRTFDSQKTPLEIRVELQRKQIQELDKPDSEGQLPYQDAESLERIELLEQQLEQLESDLQREKATMKPFFQARETLAAANRLSDQTIVKVAQFTPTLSACNKKELNTFLLLSHFLIPTLKTQVTAQAEHLGIKTVIDSEMVDDAIRNELENDQRAQLAIARGREQLQLRQNPLDIRG